LIIIIIIIIIIIWYDALSQYDNGLSQSHHDYTRQHTQTNEVKQEHKIQNKITYIT